MHIAACISTSYMYFFNCWILSMVRIYHILFIHLLAGSHLHCFHFWLLQKRFNEYLYISLYGHIILFLLGIYLGVQFLGDMVSLRITCNILLKIFDVQNNCIQLIYTTWWIWRQVSFQEGFPGSSAGQESACNAEDPSLIPGLGSSPGEGIGYWLQYSWASLLAQMVKNLSAMQETGFDPWVGTIPWRRAWQPTPVFLPGESHGQRSLVDYSPWGHKE